MLKRFCTSCLAAVTASMIFFGSPAFAAAARAEAADKGTSLWTLIISGGTCMIFLGLASVAVVTFAIYHFMYVTPKKLTPQDLTDTLVSLLEKKEYKKAVAVCKQQQDNLISGIALKGLEKIGESREVIEAAIQCEGKMRSEKLWQNLSYLGDIGVIAPMLGLLGTIFGMIDAFHYFKPGSVHPLVLTQGLAKAMINTAFGLLVAIPAMVFYGYFRGRISQIVSKAESVATEMIQILTKG